MTPQPRTQGELIEKSCKVLYKIWMFAQTSRLTSGGKPPADQDFDQQVVTSALAESMLIHTRELMHFLYAPPSRNYIRAVDYLGDRSAIPPKWPEYNNDLAQIDRDTAHLTYDEVPNPVRITAPGHLATALMAFVRAVPDDLVQPHFRTIAWGVLADRLPGANFTVAPKDKSHPPVRGHRIHELFEDG